MTKNAGDEWRAWLMKKQSTQSDKHEDKDALLEELSHHVGQIDLRVSNLVDDVASNQGRLDTLSTDVRESHRKIDLVNTQLVEYKFSGRGIYSGISTNDSRIEALARDSVSNNRKLETCKKDIESNLSKMDALDNGVRLIGRRLETIENGLSSNTLSMEVLTGQFHASSKKTDDDIASIKTREEVLANEIKGSRVRLQKLEGSVSEVDSKLQASTNSWSANLQKMQTVETEIAEHKAKEEILERELFLNNHRVAEFENVFEGVRNALNVLESGLEVTARRIEDIVNERAKDSQIQSQRFDALEDLMSERNMRIDLNLEGLKHDVSEKEARLKSLEDSGVFAKERITGLSDEIAENKGKFETLQSEITEIKNKIELLNSIIASSVRTIREEISESIQKIQFLENDFARASETTSQRIAVIEKEMASRAVAKERARNNNTKHLDAIWQLEELELEEL